MVSRDNTMESTLTTSQKSAQTLGRQTIPHIVTPSPPFIVVPSAATFPFPNTISSIVSKPSPAYSFREYGVVASNQMGSPLLAAMV